jgi:23S rRNA (pseudouridine1915-N3)-methyltransferase
MQIVIAAVGRMKRGAAADMIAEYVKRTRWDLGIKEIADAPSNMAPAARKAKEAEALLALLDKETRLIALDSRGQQMTSETFAKTILKIKNAGAKKLVLAIGGQDGLDASVLDKASATLAFGAATWPHQLVRLMLAEQVYRAYTIEAGHPYHLGH